MSRSAGEVSGLLRGWQENQNSRPLLNPPVPDVIPECDSCRKDYSAFPGTGADKAPGCLQKVFQRMNVSGSLLFLEKDGYAEGVSFRFVLCC